MGDNEIAVPNHDTEHAALPSASGCALWRSRCLPVLAILMTACHEGSEVGGGSASNRGGRGIGVLPGRPLALHINGPGQITQPGSAQYTAVQSWSDGSTTDVTASAEWTSTKPWMLSISAGLATGLATGEAALTARVEQFSAQPRSVHVVPLMPEWNGTYALTVGGGTCSGTLPLELRQRVFTATVSQIWLGLNVSISAGYIYGRIVNPETYFYLPSGAPIAATARLKRVVAVDTPHFQLQFRRAAYGSYIPPVFEVLPDGTRLLISGTAVTTGSSSGFLGTLNGALTLYDSQGRNVLATCSSAGHVFRLART